MNASAFLAMASVLLLSTGGLTACGGDDGATSGGTPSTGTGASSTGTGATGVGGSGASGGSGGSAGGGAGGGSVVPDVANLWIDGDGGRCTRQRTPSAYVDADACASVEEAWSAASDGDTIVIKAGTYGPQAAQGDKSAATTIIGEDGTTLGTVTAGGSFMTLENVTIDAGDSHGQSNGAEIGEADVTFRNVDLWGAYVSMYVAGARFAWHKGSLGKDGTTGGQRQLSCDGGNGDGLPIWIESGATGATIDGVRFNPQLADGTPVSCSANGFHLENIRVQETQDVTIENNWFLAGSDAGSGHVFVTSVSPSSSAATGFALVNNVFEPVNGSYAMQVHTNVTNCAWTIAYNTLHQDLSLACDDSGATWVGNLGSYPGCAGTHINNVFQRSSSFDCGSDKWVEGPDYETDKLGIGSGGHLMAGSPAIDAGETAGADDFCTGAKVGARDFEGDARPVGAACDAGADEFGGN